ncbi:MAG: putative Ig domain-containing protein, partial [Candidatus Thiodiazotropha sp.]
ATRMVGCGAGGTTDSNTPPTIQGVPPSGVSVNSNYNFIPTVTDADGDTLTFSISNPPSWCSFNTATGELSGIPADSDVGIFNDVMISVSDGTDSVALPTFAIAVTESSNNPPTISGSPTSSILVNENYSFTPTATDADNDTLTFDIANSPSWCSFNNTTGELFGTPGIGDVGVYADITISVSDGAESIALPAFTISVLSAPGGGATGIAPVLNFTDLISGPGTGLDDGLGSGVIVTVWGQNLGSSQADSTITFTDAGSNETSSAHVYYWKRADGSIPGGPADLYASHAMQEIAFSIPDVMPGEGTIHVTVNGVTSNALPFTVRSGTIYHVKSSGDDNNGDGSFGNPWSSVGHALDQIDEPGSTLYVHNSLVSDSNPHKAIYWNHSAASSGLRNQFGIVAYPGSQPRAVGYSGFRNYNTAGQVVSKYSVYASECDEGNLGQPTNCATTPSLNQSFGIQSSAYGRAVGNAITDRPGGCADGTQAAISGNALSGRDRVSGYRILGNEIYDYGCAGSNKLHHTTYLSVRSGSDNLQVDPWRFGWNFLHDNKTKNGIHQYDENHSGTLCGSPSGTVVINDNVIINQSGAGISVGANCPWTNNFKIYNNVLINVGLAADWDGIDTATSNGPNTSGISVQDGGLMGSVEIYNNTIHTWNNDDLPNDTQACLGVQGTGDNVTIVWSDNVCYTNNDKPFVDAGCCGAEVQLDNITGENNAWYYSGNSPSYAIPPGWDVTGITQDPLLSISGVQVEVGAGSPLIGAGANNLLTHDIYGLMRSTDSAIGAVQFSGNP